MGTPVVYIVYIINSGVNSGIIGCGNSVLACGSELDTHQVKKAKLQELPVFAPSGSVGVIGYGALGDRFRHPGFATTIN